MDVENYQLWAVYILFQPGQMRHNHNQKMFQTVADIIKSSKTSDDVDLITLAAFVQLFFTIVHFLVCPQIACLN